MTLALLAGLFLGWSLGANDAANVIGPAVTSRMIRFRTAAILAAILVLGGAIAQGHEGIDTIGGLTEFAPRDAAISSLAAAITVTLMTLLGLPVSTSQAVVGAILGVGLVNGQVYTTGLGKVLACWLGTPFGGLLISIILYRALASLYNQIKISPFQYDRLMRILLIGAGLYGSYALGANNVANVTAVYVGAGQLDVLSALLIGGASIGLGILTFSRRVMDTVGLNLLRLDAFSSLAVLLAEALTVHIYSFVGVPVSTSQAIIGAVMGVGIVKGVSMVRGRTLAGILAGWFLTPVAASLIAIGLEFVSHLRYVA
ncbi:MAG: anion permease [Deltaproteobacteria bacterium]|nr:anion permease [Deltaproteobacteria bacterium]MBW2136411.1 anion permease [Deltaproteobacteria bacterium]